jgi:hypothetical protein
MDYTQTPTDKLYRHYANCCATAAGALGNSKAHYNDERAHCIAKELEARREEVPSPRTAARFGTFNGEGSY